MHSAPSPSFADRALRGLAVLTACAALTGAAFAQADSNAPAADANANRRNRPDRANFNPEEMQQRLLGALREQLGVTDDAEWKVISDRVMAIYELRRSAGGGFGGFRPGGPQGARTGRTANPEADALRQAVTDKLTDAEIQARLARLREVRKANEEKLTKAQEDLRAVLSVRQEAIAVLYGLLP